MNAIELHLPQDLDQSFVFFNEKGSFFPCPLHYHPEYELVLVLKSTGQRFVGDHIGKFKPGDLVFMGSMLPHVWINDPIYINGTSKSEADALVIHFKRDFLGNQFFDKPEMRAMNKLLTLSARGLEIRGKIREKVNTIMKRMILENEIQRLSSLLTIFDVLSSKIEYQLLASPEYMEMEQEKELSGLDNVVEYLKNNFDNEILVKDMAAKANVGLTTFCNMFKKNYRKTFTEFLNSIRIGHACKLLGDEDQNIAEIAYSCGFNTLANFNRQFKRYKKMTPSQYRDRLNDNLELSSRFNGSESKSSKYLAV